MEIRRRRIVRTRRADDENPLEPQRCLERPQRMDLTRDADDGDPLVPGGPRRFEQRQQRRIAHPHAAHLRHAFGFRHDHRHRFPLVIGVGRHRQHGIDGTGAQQFFGDPRRDAGPLRARDRCLQRGAVHRLIGPEERLVGALRVAGAAVHPGFEGGVIGLDELAGGAAILRAGSARDAAIGAQPARRGGGERRRPDGGLEGGHWVVLGVRITRMKHFPPPSRGRSRDAALAAARVGVGNRCRRKKTPTRAGFAVSRLPRRGGG